MVFLILPQVLFSFSIPRLLLTSQIGTHYSLLCRRNTVISNTYDKIFMLGQDRAIQKWEGINILILAVVSTKVLINSLGDLFNSCIGHLLYTRYLDRCFMIRVVFLYIVVCCCWRKGRRKKNTL